MTITTVQALQQYITWLPYLATFQLSFNKQYARMYKTIFDKKAELEVLATYGLKKFAHDGVYVYFSTDENIAKFQEAKTI